MEDSKRVSESVRAITFLESFTVGDLLVEDACLLVIRERKGGQAVLVLIKVESTESISMSP